MASGQGAVAQNLHRLFATGTLAGFSEGQLLDAFAVGRDEGAFEALVARHGPMVLGVCRRALSDPNDADDAFQATFLILARRAGSLRDRELVGAWLYAVARKTAARARADAARRRRRDRASVPAESDLAPAEDPARRELAEAVRGEVDRLPPRFRAAVVLCDLAGHTHAEAARELGIPIGTVKSRQSRAHALLKSRLGRRGLDAPAVLLVAALAPEATAAPATLIHTTARAAILIVAGRGVSGLVSAPALALAHGASPAMILGKITAAAAATLAVGLAATALGQRGPQVEPPKPEQVEATEPALRRDPPRDDGPVGTVEVLKILPTLPVESQPETLVDAARKAYRESATFYVNGRITTEIIIEWSKRLLDAERTADANGDPIKPYSDHFARMQEIEAKERKELAIGRSTSRNLATTRYFRIEAEQMLAQAKRGRTEPQQPEVNTAKKAEPKAPKAIQDFGGVGGGGFEGNLPDEGPRTKLILAKLGEPITMQFPNETPLEDVLKYMKTATADKEQTGVQFYLDPIGLSEADRTQTSPIAIDLEAIPLRTALFLTLRSLDLTYFVRDGIIIITSPNLAESSFDGLMRDPSEIPKPKQSRGTMGGGGGGGGLQ